MLLADAESVNGGGRLFFQTDFLQQRLGTLISVWPVHDAATGTFISNEKILGNGQKRHQREFLVDNNDPEMFTVGNTSKASQLSVIVNLTVIAALRVNARKNLHQGGFSGTIFTNKRVDLTFGNFEINVIQRFDPGKSLGDIAHFQQCLHRPIPRFFSPPRLRFAQPEQTIVRPLLRDRLRNDNPSPLRSLGSLIRQPTQAPTGRKELL